MTHFIDLDHKLTPTELGRLLDAGFEQGQTRIRVPGLAGLRYPETAVVVNVDGPCMDLVVLGDGNMTAYVKRHFTVTRHVDEADHGRWDDFLTLAHVQTVR
jgi:hypothetical protein